MVVTLYLFVYLCFKGVYWRMTIIKVFIEEWLYNWHFWKMKNQLRLHFFLAVTGMGHHLEQHLWDTLLGRDQSCLLWSSGVALLWLLCPNSLPSERRGTVLAPGGMVVIQTMVFILIQYWSPSSSHTYVVFLRNYWVGQKVHLFFP